MLTFQASGVHGEKSPECVRAILVPSQLCLTCFRCATGDQLIHFQDVTLLNQLPKCKDFG